MLRIRLPLWPALALSASACWVPLERGEMMDSRLDKLEAASSEQAQRLEDQQRRIEDQEKVLKDRVAAVDKKLIEAQQKIDELNQAARRSGADLAVNLSRQQEDLARLRGDLEVEQHRLGEVEKSLATTRTDTEGKLAALRGAGALDEFEARRKIAALDKPDDKGAVLALALKEEQAGEKGVAREIYLHYVRRWPTDARAAEAGYRAGDLFAGQQRWREAILAYGKVAEDFPRSERAPDALLRVATSMLQLEMKDDARPILNQVVERYPKAPAAKTARQKLEELYPPEPKADPKSDPKKHPKAGAAPRH